jgi:hypothetical protein
MGIGTCYLSTSFSFMPLFFSQYSHTRQRAYAKYVQCSTTFFFFYFIFAYCRQTSHSLPCSRFFPDPESRLSTIHPSFLALSRVWPLADPESHSPHPLLLSSSWALFTFFCLLIYDPAMLLSSLPRSLLFYRSRALPYISYPSPPPTQTSMLFLQAPLPSVFPSIFSILLVEISHDKLQRIQNPKRQCL